MKTLQQVLEDAEGKSPGDVGLELSEAIAASDVEFNSAELVQVLDEYVTDVAHMLLNVVLDLAGSMGALPEGRDGAQAELEQSLAFIKTCAIYTVVAQKTNAEEADD